MRWKASTVVTMKLWKGTLKKSLEDGKTYVRGLAELTWW
jgi:hypothetical protein